MNNESILPITSIAQQILTLLDSYKGRQIHPYIFDEINIALDSIQARYYLPSGFERPQLFVRKHPADPNRLDLKFGNSSGFFLLALIDLIAKKNDEDRERGLGVNGFFGQT